MKSLIVFTLLIASAFAGSQVTDLLDKLDDLLIKAHTSKNIKAVEAIEDAIDTVTFAAASLKSSSVGDAETFHAALDDVEKDISSFEKMLNSSIKSRNWFTSTLSFAGSTVSSIFSKFSGYFKVFQDSGLGGLVAIFQPFIDQISNNPSIKGVIAGLKTVEQGVSSLNKMTGGAIGPLNTLSDVLNNIESAGDLVNSMTNVNSSEALADALINTLTSSKSANLQKIEKGLDYVCNGLNDAQTATAA